MTLAPEYHFHGGPPKPEDMKWAIQELGWCIARKGGMA
jgi:hypothetical protein